MSGAATTMLVNAGLATLLALALFAGERFIRRPALVHALWLVLLIKLVTPSLVEWSVIPPIAPPIVNETSSEQEPAADSLVVVSPIVLPPETPDGVISAVDAWLGLWLGGALLVVGTSVFRWRRFRSMLDDRVPTPAEIAERVEALARRIGLRRVPRVRVVPARISPMVWWRIGGAELVLPSELLCRLDGDELDALLTHELAHLKRRDPWIRYLELAVSALYWWHPVVWWARSRLRRAEEQCCDAWVLRTLPGHPRIYARALMKTLEFLTGHAARIPVTATGAGEVDHMKERLTMIMKRGARPRMSRTQSVLLAVAATAILLVFPTWSERADAGAPAAEPETTAAQEDLVMLEHQAMELERQLAQIRIQQRKLELDMENKRQRQELDRLAAEAQRLEADGDRKEADFVRRQIQRFVRQQDLQARALELKTDALRQMESVEVPMDELWLEAEQAEAEGDAYRAAELRARAKKLKLERVVTEMNAQDAFADLEREMRLLKLQALKEEMELGQLPSKRSPEETLRKLQQKYEKLAAKAELLAAEDRHDAARELEHRARDLEREIDAARRAGEAR